MKTTLAKSKHPFCPSCHREIKKPDFLDKVKGNVNLICSNCKQGKIVIKSI